MLFQITTSATTVNTPAARSVATLQEATIAHVGEDTTSVGTYEHAKVTRSTE